MKLGNLYTNTSLLFLDNAREANKKVAYCKIQVRFIVVLGRYYSLRTAIIAIVNVSKNVFILQKMGKLHRDNHKCFGRPNCNRVLR